ncbi:hypothetical protein Glaag_0257 [Glaciecola sp. 4H-3-7+YE-5]|jgi:hypothetical protein|nr:hypothetical protein Glaag_0257 [Glaciecola sp. 4H-3-7+YE-5]
MGAFLLPIKTKMEEDSFEVEELKNIRSIQSE